MPAKAQVLTKLRQRHTRIRVDHSLASAYSVTRPGAGAVATRASGEGAPSESANKATMPSLDNNSVAASNRQDVEAPVQVDDQSTGMLVRKPAGGVVLEDQVALSALQAGWQAQVGSS